MQHPTTQFFTGRMPFLPPYQQRQSTEGNKKISNYKKSTQNTALNTHKKRDYTNQYSSSIVQTVHCHQSLQYNII